MSNLIGPPSFGADQMGRVGIFVQHQNNVTVSGNEIRSIGSSPSIPVGASGDRVGIGIGTDEWLSLFGYTSVTNSRITGNIIHDIVEEKTRSAAGIIVSGSGNPSNNVVANNMIYNVRSNGTFGEQCVGIGIGAGNGDKVVFNSIRLEGDIDTGSVTSATGSTAGIRVGSFSVQNLTLMNNIVSVDMNSNTASLNHYAIVVPSSSYTWGTGGIDFNNYHINASNTQMKLGGVGTLLPYTAVADLAGWKSVFTPNRDANSKSFQPDYTSASDLHLNVSSQNLNYKGTPIAGVTTDFDGETRHNVAPYIGADEKLDIVLLDVPRITSNAVPQQYRLMQNYPNPFNPSTTIRYQLPEAGMVELTVFDMLGREVKTLIREKQEAGTYAIHYNAAALSSGVYLYRIHANGFTQTKKLLLVK
ncbi:MAG: T9SS type A sorting domain-containing protein [Ignavibacteriales bacterium]|nr:T9SS type A sorting domain-containing protein [Ignavibacteriales bacterium]